MTDEEEPSSNSSGFYLEQAGGDTAVLTQAAQLRAIWEREGWETGEWMHLWYTVPQLSEMTGQIPTAVSANCRTLRKKKGGLHHVDVVRRERGSRVYSIRVWPPGTRQKRHYHCGHYRLACELGFLTKAQQSFLDARFKLEDMD